MHPKVVKLIILLVELWSFVVVGAFLLGGIDTMIFAGIISIIPLAIAGGVLGDLVP